MNPILNFVFTAGFATIIVTLINGLILRRKTGAETEQLSAGATKIITEAAGAVVKDLREDNARLRTELSERKVAEAVLEARLSLLEAERDEERELLRIHGIWDREALAAVRAAIPPIKLRTAPPLTHARAEHLDDGRVDGVSS